MPEAAEVFEDSVIIQSAIDNFSALIDDMDYDYLLEHMNIGRMQFMLRKQMRTELRGLFIALWRLALGRSFPTVGDMMLAAFLQRYRSAYPGKAGSQTVERAKEYWGMIQPVGDQNFNVVAQHLTSFLLKDEKQVRPLTLKLALAIRRSYCFIFERLI